MRKKLDLTGQRFGDLTVLRPAGNIGKQTAWVCRCDCGRETVVRTCNLRSGGTKTCGCRRTRDPQEMTLVSERTLRKRLDLTGQRFGKLTVLFPSENIGAQTAWVCRCDCGQNTVVRTRTLRSGEVNTCGCRSGTRDPLDPAYMGSTYDERRILRKRLDLTGQRFGQLTVLRPAENIGKRTAWVCVCDCGQETVVMTGNLRSGHTRGCGCQCTRAARRSGTPEKRDGAGVAAGIEWLPRERRWKASISFLGKRYNLGAYDEFEDALQARKSAEAYLHERALDEYTG